MRDEFEVPLRKRTLAEQAEWDLSVVTDYFVHKHKRSEVMKRYNIKAIQTLYNARNRVNKLLRKQKASI